MAQSQPKLVRDLKAIIAKRSVANHPFYQAWTKGREAREEALEAATRVADGYWSFLDGVMDASM